MSQGLSRRHFIIGAGALAAGIALPRLASLDLHKPPPGMEWLPFASVSFDSAGIACIPETMKQLRTTVFDLPLKADKLIHPGFHQPFQVRADDRDSDKARSFFGYSNPVGQASLHPQMTVIKVSGPAADSLSWDLEQGFWVATLVAGAEPLALLDKRQYDEFNRPIPLRLGDKPRAGCWYFDSKTLKLYVCEARFRDTAAIARSLDIVWGGTESTLMRVQGGEAYFENILFLGVMPWVLNAGGKVAKAIFKNCAFWYSPGEGVANEGGYVVLDGCEIYRCRNDGIGSHQKEGVQARHIAINTVVRYAGDVDTYGTAGENQNGFSMHESGLSAIIGCDVRKSCGPNLIDTGSGPGSTGVSWWCRVNCQDSLGKNPANFESYGVRTVWMELCTEAPSDKVTVRFDGEGTVVHYSRNRVGDYVTINGAVALPIA